MHLGGIGVPELLIILLVVLVIFGPKNLPKLGSTLGKTVKNMREGMESAPEIDFDSEADSQETQDDAEETETKPSKKKKEHKLNS